MSDDPQRERSRWRLTPLGWILAVALLVFAILAMVDPSRGVYFGLTAAIVAWGTMLGSSFPSISSRGTPPGEIGRTDFGREAEERYRREHGLD